MRRRRLPILVVLLALAAAIAVGFYYWRKGPPEAVRLLPESDAVMYVDFGLLRRAGVFERMGPVSEEPEYQRFVAESGFRFERDLDELAIAVHAPPVGPPGGESRYSEVFAGRFDAARATAWLRHVATHTERYQDLEIFSIPHEGRTVRVALLGATLAAASNTESDQPIHRIVDSYQRPALPPRGPSLVRERYERVPAASLVWVMARVAGAGMPGVTTPSLVHDLAPGALLVGSLRWAVDVQARLEAETVNESQARQIAANVEAWLVVFRALEDNVQLAGSDADVKAAFDSLHVELEGNRVRLGVDVPLGVLKKIAATPPAVAPPESKPQAPEKPAIGKPTRRR